MKAITTDNFEKEVLQAELPVVVKFWAPWCGHCITLNPVFEELEKEFDGKVEFVTLNVDEAPEISQKYFITGIPACIKFEGGEPVERVVGALPKNSIVSMLKLA